MTEAVRAEDLLRELTPQVLGALLRRYGNLELCEDAVQDTLVEAYTTWTERGISEQPRGWLHTVANRRMIDLIRSENARRSREERLLVGAPPAEVLRIPGEDAVADRDDSLLLLLLCCHPTLTAPSRIALTLRAVGGLTTREIAAAAFFVPEATMAQRISRAKQRIREAGATFSMPGGDELDDRLRAVQHVLYLIFNEGYTSYRSGQESEAAAVRAVVPGAQLKSDPTATGVRLILGSSFTGVSSGPSSAPVAAAGPTTATGPAPTQTADPPATTAAVTCTY